jgi:hypothetical protein
MRPTRRRRRVAILPYSYRIIRCCYVLPSPIFNAARHPNYKTFNSIISTVSVSPSPRQYISRHQI